MIPRKLIGAIVICELLGLGVFFAFLLGATATARGGVATIDMTLFAERWAEYGMMLVLTAVAPLALYRLDEWVQRQE